MIDADDDDRDRALEHPRRDHAQEPERQRILYRDEAMQSTVAGIGSPASRLQDRLELLARDGLLGHGAGHAPRPDGVEHRIGHGVAVFRAKCATRCRATAAHTASSFIVYSAGSTVLTAVSEISRNGPASNARVSGETRAPMKSARRAAAVSKRRGPYSAAS